MPININNNLPAAQMLQREGIFIMDEQRASAQDIRPLRIALMNLMPTKITTEMQILRLLGNSPLQVDMTLLHPVTHVSKNTSIEYLDTYYKGFDEIADEHYDGLIITGAPVETLEFEEVNYWEELTRVMNWSRHNVFSTLHICWGAQAGLYYHFGIPKKPLDKKIFGIFPHRITANTPLMNGFDDLFYVPHSRHTTVLREDVLKHPEVSIFSESDEAGVFIAGARKGRQIFVTGHLEYDRETLKGEYDRDIAKGMKMDVPQHYYPDDDPTCTPIVNWRAHANLLFVNWLNYYVYQKTPFDLNELKDIAEETES